MHEMTLYQKILESNLVNFIIMVTILTVIFKKAKLGSIFDKMANDIKTSVMTSSEAAQNALKEYKEAKRSTKNLKIEKDEIVNKAYSTAKNAKENIENVISKEEALLDNQYLNKIESDTLKAKEDATKEFLNVIAEFSKEEIQNRLNSNYGTKIHSRLIDKCIEDIETMDFSEVLI